VRDLEGFTFESRRRTITDVDFSLLNTLVWAIAPIHTDRTSIESSGFSDLVMDGPAALAVAIGLAVMAESDAVWVPHALRPVALLGLENVKFLAPTYSGDTLSVESAVTSWRESSNKGRYVARYRESADKSDGTSVITWDRVMLIESV